MTHLGVVCVCPAMVNTGFAKSERNRPTEYKNEEGKGAKSTPNTKQVKMFAERGMDPARVADLTFDAIQSGQFYCYVDNESDLDWSMRCVEEVSSARLSKQPPAPTPLQNLKKVRTAEEAEASAAQGSSKL